MPSSVFDIEMEQGETFSLFLTFNDRDGNGVDLSTYDGRMQVRRTHSSEPLLIFATGTTAGGSVTGGGVTGEWTDGNTFAGVGGTGGMSLNVDSSAVVGNTGGILIQIDALTTSLIPSGRHFYDVEVDSNGTVTKIVRGRFEVLPEVTR